MREYKISLLFISLLLFATVAQAANYTLEIIAPQEGLTTGTAAQNRYYKNYTGIAYEVPIGVFGGLYPFTYELTTAPSGMVIDADTGVITWSNPTTGSHSIAVLVTDDESNTDTVSWTLTVDTANAVFLDANTDSSGTGTIDDPFDSLEDIWGSDGLTTTYDGDFLYFAEGTYGIEGGWRSNCPGQQCKVSWNVNSMPHVWIGYEAGVVIDHDFASGSNGIYLATDNGADDLWVSNIKFQDMLNHAIRTTGSESRQVIYDCEFFNGGPGADGQNSSFLMFTGASVTGAATYQFVKDNVFDTASEWAFIKTYSTNKLVFEGNTIENPSGSTEGLAIKAYDQYMSVRANTFDGDFTAGSISGNWNQVDYLDISFNNIKNADTSGDLYDHGAIEINHDSTSGPAHIYRNTLEGIINYRGSSDDGPIYIYSNVIVNEQAAYDDPDGSLIQPFAEGSPSPSQLVLGTGDSANLVGNAADAIIDANGDLTEAYSAYLGTHGYQLTATPTPTPASTASGNWSTQ